VNTGTSHPQEWEPIDGNQPAEAGEPNRSAPGTNEQRGRNKCQEQKLINGNQEAGTLDQWEPNTGSALMIINTGSADERLMMAYQSMNMEGNKITGETLSKRALSKLLLNGFGNFRNRRLIRKSVRRESEYR